MRRPDGHAVITDEISLFQAEVHRLALAIARAVVEEELEEKRAALRTSRPPKQAALPVAQRARREAKAEPAKPAKPEPAKRKPARAAAPDRQLELGLLSAPPAAAPASVSAQAASAQTELALTAAPPVAPIAEQPPTAVTAAPMVERKRGKWTRETIIAELSTWMSKRTTIDAGFMTRNGPPGLVAAARRIFGRFDAALNVVALHMSKTAPPEGAPPARGT